MKTFVKRYQKLRTLERIIEEHNTAFATRPEMVAVMAEFSQKLNEMGALITKMSRSVSNIYRVRNNVSSQFRTKLVQATSVLVNLSSGSNDAPTLRMLKDYKTDMAKVGGHKLYETGLHIEELLTSKAEELSGLGYLEADLQAYSGSLQQLSVALREKNFQLNLRRTAREELRILFVACNNLLKDRIDTSAILVSAENPGFYTEYLQARRKKRRGRAAAEEGVSEITGEVVDANTGNPVAGAQVTLIQQSEVTETDDGGMYEFTGLFEGKYTLGCFAPGYQVPDNQEITLGADDIAEVTFTLQPANPVLN